MESDHRLEIRPEELLFFAIMALGLMLNLLPGTGLALDTVLSVAISNPVIRFASAGLACWILLVVPLAFFSRGSGLLALTCRSFRDFLPLFCMPLIYETVHSLGPRLHDHVFDQILLRADFALTQSMLFVSVPKAIYSSPAGQSLTYFFAFCYGAVFVIYWGLAFFFFFCYPRQVFRKYMLAVFITSVMGYLGYLLIPAIGPYEAFVRSTSFGLESYAGLGAFTIISHYADHIRAFHVDRLPASDCFPSLHTAWSVLSLGFCWRYAKWLLVILLPLAFGTVIGALYLQQHYLVDLLGGAAVAIAGTAAAAWLVQGELQWAAARRPLPRGVLA